MIQRRSLSSTALWAFCLLAASACAGDPDPAQGNLSDLAAAETIADSVGTTEVDAAVEPSDAPAAPDTVDDTAVQVETVTDTGPVEPPLDPITEACTELFPPLCAKLAECALGPEISTLLGPACDALLAGASGIVEGLCGQVGGFIPGGDFVADLIAGFLFPAIQTCIEEFACTPENIAYFAEGLGGLAGLLGGQGGGGFDFSSVNELIDLFTDCDEPPPAPEPVADASDGGGEVVEPDGLAGDAIGPELPTDGGTEDAEPGDSSSTDVAADAPADDAGDNPDSVGDVNAP